MPSASVPVVDTAPAEETATPEAAVVVVKLTAPASVVVTWSLKVALCAGVTRTRPGELCRIEAAVRHGRL